MHLRISVTIPLLWLSVANAQLSWADAYTKAKQAVSGMSVSDLVALGTGASGNCLGNVAAVGSIPAMCLQDSPIAVRLAFNVTGGIAGVNVAATFDQALAFQRGQDMGAEFKGKGVNIQLGPDINMMRSPDAGRNWETFGEDPYLTGVMAAATIQGTQSQGVVATAKHFILYEQETDRMWESSNADDRTLHEIYAWPFARAVEAGVGAVMCSYNRINDTYACQNSATLTTLLKNEMGFQGFVMSDWGATQSGAPSSIAGLDMDQPGGDGNWGSNLVSAVNSGAVPLSRVTDAATRILAAFYKMGQDSNFPAAAINSNNPGAAPYVNVQGNHGQTIRQIGAASAILLKNQGNILPLKSPTTLGVIGGDAGPSAGTYGPQGCQIETCDNGTLAMGWGSGGSYLPYLVTPIQGIQNRAPATTTIISSLDVWDYQHAASVAATVDVAIVFGNADSGEGIDRNNLSLWYNADALINAVADANPNTIAVIHAAGPVLMPWINKVKAVIYAGLPGQESGNSLADVLFGDVNPSGRLPYTLAVSDSDYPAHISTAADISYNEGLFVGYRYFDAHNINPLFEFGFGLSYTNFTYSGMSISTNSANVTISVAITNSGNVAGAEIPQLYIGFPAVAGEPPKVLRGFNKVMIQPAAKTTVSFQVNIVKELSIWDTAINQWSVVGGTFTAYVGASSRDIRLQGSFTISGSTTSTTATPTTTTTITTTTTTSATSTSSNGWTYLGCYIDALNPRTLPYGAPAITSGMTVEGCEQECAASNYSYAGVEYGNECWCGNTMPPTAASASDCNMPCKGNSAEMCGAGARFNVYKY